MADLTADLFVTLDGFAAGVDTGAFFDCPGADLDAWVRRESEAPQILVMGRVTYEALAEISSSAVDEASARMNDLPKAVFSNTLREPLSWKNTRLIHGDLAEGIGALKWESEVPLRSIGSLMLVRGLLELGLVDRLRLMVFPLTLGGDGREPAFAGHPRTGLELAGTRVLDSRLVLLEYRPEGVSPPVRPA
ncbi:dihydrofolate reductase family protein [Planobispora takensis]|uniref:Deaminase reductase n=1 Tax=Planobispora takensis TaxID=1367882 RepID=A0A8J3SWD3_9ACTN|nr:dihydrofolate reductase family protein [Planobispora takensis]GII01712.1 deaminase reductase [Planobispora takensis]